MAGGCGGGAAATAVLSCCGHTGDADDLRKHAELRKARRLVRVVGAASTGRAERGEVQRLRSAPATPTTVLCRRCLSKRVRE